MQQILNELERANRENIADARRRYIVLLIAPIEGMSEEDIRFRAQDLRAVTAQLGLTTEIVRQEAELVATVRRALALVDQQREAGQLRQAAAKKVGEANETCKEEIKAAEEKLRQVCIADQSASDRVRKIHLAQLDLMRASDPVGNSPRWLQVYEATLADWRKTNPGDGSWPPKPATVQAEPLLQRSVPIVGGAIVGGPIVGALGQAKGPASGSIEDLVARAGGVVASDE